MAPPPRRNALANSLTGSLATRSIRPCADCVVSHDTSFRVPDYVMLRVDPRRLARVFRVARTSRSAGQNRV